MSQNWRNVYICTFIFRICKELLKLTKKTTQQKCTLTFYRIRIDILPLQVECKTLPSYRALCPPALYDIVAICTTFTYIENPIKQCYSFCFRLTYICFQLTHILKLKGRKIYYCIYLETFHFCWSSFISEVRIFPPGLLSFHLKPLTFLLCWQVFWQ